MMKYFFMMFCLQGLAVTAQVNNPVQLSHYVFDSFSKGTVQVKSGTVYEQSLNYNTLTGEMIFDDGGRLMAISKPEDVDTIFILGRKFIPVNDKFYEVLANTPAPLLIEYTAKIEEPAVSVGYGNASATTNATSYSSIVRSGMVNQIRLPDDFKVIPGYTYWIRKDNKYQKAGTAKQVINIFPAKKEWITGLVKKDHTLFSERAKMILLVQQIQQ